MAQFGKLSGTITDDQGNPISGATVEVRRQGAFVTSSQAGPTYTVNDPGGIEVGDQVRPNALSGPTRNVSAVTATTVTTSGAGLGSLVNNDRITIQSALPTLYADASGSETRTNPVTTDASGFWYCWVQVRPYDIIETYGSTVRLKTDLTPEGMEYAQSNIFQGAGAIAYRRGTTRTLTSGKLLVLDNPITTEKFSVDYAGNVVATGNLTAVNGTFSGNASVTGNLTVTGDLGVDDITSDDISAQDLTVTGTLTYSGAAGNLSLTAGSIETADLATNCVVVTRTADGTADDTLTAAAAYADITGATLTFTPASSTSEIVIMAYCPVTSSAAANAFFQIADGSNNALAEGTIFFTNANSAEVGALIYRVTGLTGSQTFKVRGKCTTANCSCPNSTNAAVKRVTRIVAMEFKK